MSQLLQSFWFEELGQDFVEHALLLAMISLAAAGLFFSSGASVSGVWSAADSKITVAYKSAVS